MGPASPTSYSYAWSCEGDVHADMHAIRLGLRHVLICIHAEVGTMEAYSNATMYAFIVQWLMKLVLQ